MQLKSITIENFKGITGPLSINLKPITLLFGMNSAGKSTIIQALNYIKRVFLCDDLDSYTSSHKIDAINLGSFENIVHNHDLSLPIVFNLFFEVEDEKVARCCNQIISASKEHLNVEMSIVRDFYGRSVFLAHTSKLIDPDLSIGGVYGYFITAQDDVDPKRHFSSQSSDMELTAKKIKNLSIKIVIKWNKDLERTYIELYETSINGERIFQIFRTACDGKPNDQLVNFFRTHCELSLYEHEIWPSDIENIIQKNNSRKRKELEKFVKSIEDGIEESKEKPHPNTLIQIQFLQEKINQLKPDRIIDNSPSKWVESQPDMIMSEQQILGFSRIKLKTHNSYLGENLLDSFNFEQNTLLPDPDQLLSFSTDFLLPIVKYEDFGPGAKAEEKFYINLLSALVTTPIRFLKEKLFSDLYHIGPLRELPARDYQSSKQADKSGWITGLAAYDALLHPKTTGETINRINSWLSDEKRFNTGYQIEIKRYQQLDMDGKISKILNQDSISNDELKKIRSEIQKLDGIEHKFNLVENSTKTKLEMQDVGTGISQIFPIIVGSLILKNSMITMEQPDLHIHPALQLVLGDLFIESIRENENANMLIVENHSEHLMLRILRRIRESADKENGVTPVSSESIGVYYVFKCKQETKVAYIPIADDGEFACPWPNGFFPERAEELFS